MAKKAILKTSNSDIDSTDTFIGQYFDNEINPFPNKPWFLRVWSTSLLKTLWEKEKLLVTSNFSFSHSVFYPFEELPSFFVKFEIVICKLFKVWKSLTFVVWERVKKSLDPSLSDTQTDLSMSCHSPPWSIDQGQDTLSKSQHIQEQQTDPEISKSIFRALPEDEISQVPMCYYIKNGILMRKWRPFDVPADDEWAVYHQIVVPKSYRHEILSIAHESPMSGHLGINKTYHKIINHFYWPRLKSDVSKYCKT